MGEAASKWSLRCHFRDRHPLDSVLLLGEGVYPKCVTCGMQMNPCRIGRGHKSTKLCRDGIVRRRQLRTWTDAALTLRRQFVVKRDVLDWVETFKYLGHVLSQDVDNVRTV